MGFHYSTHSEAVFIRYQKDAPFFGFEGYYEALLGGWSGPNGVVTAGLGRGLRLVSEKGNYLAASAGLAVISDTTHNLGTPIEITFHVSLGRRRDNLDIAIGYVHFSNGKYFFGWSGPNYGENFVTLQAGLWF